MAVRIGLGLADFPFSDAAAFWRWVDLCEAGGVDSLWQSDRLSAPEPYLEALSLMAALAGATKRLKFGMNVVALGFREPLVLAKQCATIDFLSDGRLLPAFGIGALNSPDWAATGASKEGQGARADEALQIITRLWAGETVDFEGRFFRCQGARVRPAPIQKPLPLWLGGSSPAAIARTGRYATGWSAGLETPAELAGVAQAIKDAAVAAGREMDPEHFGAGFFFRFGSPDEPIVEARRAALRRIFPGRDLDPSMAAGAASDILARLQDYRDAGITKFILRPLSQGDDDLMRQTRRLIEEVLPRVHGMR